jgi:hypothetical protein
LINSRARLMPAGPAPTMQTSVVTVSSVVIVRPSIIIAVNQRKYKLLNKLQRI